MSRSRILYGTHRSEIGQLTPSIIQGLVGFRYGNHISLSPDFGYLEVVQAGRQKFT